MSTEKSDFEGLDVVDGADGRSIRRNHAEKTFLGVGITTRANLKSKILISAGRISRWCMMDAVSQRLSTMCFKWAKFTRRPDETLCRVKGGRFIETSSSNA